MTFIHTSDDEYVRLEDVVHVKRCPAGHKLTLRDGTSAIVDDYNWATALSNSRSNVILAQTGTYWLSPYRDKNGQLKIMEQVIVAWGFNSEGHLTPEGFALSENDEAAVLFPCGRVESWNGAWRSRQAYEDSLLG